MPLTGSMIAFIVLVGIVVIGVIAYVYLTVMNQPKDRQPVISNPDAEKPAPPPGPANFVEFSALVSQNQKTELVVPLLDLYTAKTRISNMLNAPGAPGISPLRLDLNMEAECVECGKRIPGKNFAPPSGDTCDNPLCESKRYTLRWLAKEDLPEEVQPLTGWVD